MTSVKYQEMPLTTPADVLAVLTSMLGCGKARNASFADANSYRQLNWSMLPWERMTRDDGRDCESEEEMSSGCDFSSFPSLSLQKKTVGGANPDLNRKDGVEAHVASLLSRPILVSNDQEKHCEDDDEDDGSEFVEESIAKVPQLMQQNLLCSFSTLVQSRLRAYATFLARHGLSLAATSEMSNQLDDPVVGVEQKLKTLLELGSLVALGDAQTYFLAEPDASTTRSENEEIKATMPLIMKASMLVLIPTLDGRSERLKIDLETAGSITGIFTKHILNPSLRVVQVDLDMPKLLTSMKNSAARTVSRIVDITNAVYSVPLPRVLSSDWVAGNSLRNVEFHPLPMPAHKPVPSKYPHIIEDDLNIITPDLASKPVSTNPSDLDLVDLEADLSSLSPDKCVKIVDSVFDEIDVRVLSPPGKRARFNPAEDVPAIALTPSLV